MRTTSLLSLFALSASLAIALPAQAQQAAVPVSEKHSLKLEIEHVIDTGVKWLIENQNAENGSWSDAEHPAISALALSAIMGHPEREESKALTDALNKGYSFILSNQKPDGGIYAKGLANYNTALSLMALLASGKDENLPSIRQARSFLIKQQADFDTPGKTDNILDGGLGYGDGSAHADLSNSRFSIEALYYSKKALADTAGGTGGEDLDWDAAIQFIERCQNSEKTVQTLKEKGDERNLTLREEDKGGFVYKPGNSKAGEVTLENGKIALRSYGSMTYAGLLSFIYADMDRGDPRIQSAMTWLRENYTLEENPGMEAQGLYYYYLTMAKGLTVANVKELELADGTKIDWREKLAVKLFDLQKQDGSWINEGSSRWRENDPALVTAYTVLALEHVHKSL